MSEILENEVKEETTEVTNEVAETPIDEIPHRVNPFCVISKSTFGQYSVRDIQSNSGWSANPYGDTYAVVPDDMVQAIMETGGFCDIELNEDGTEVVRFTARDIPDIPDAPQEPTAEERIAELEEAVMASEQAITDLDLQDIETQQAITDMDIRLMALEG